jgi:hypothetical protein
MHICWLWYNIKWPLLLVAAFLGDCLSCFKSYSYTSFSCWTDILYLRNPFRYSHKLPSIRIPFCITENLLNKRSYWGDTSALCGVVSSPERGVLLKWEKEARLYNFCYRFGSLRFPKKHIYHQFYFAFLSGLSIHGPIIGLEGFFDERIYQWCYHRSFWCGGFVDLLLYHKFIKKENNKLFWVFFTDDNYSCLALLVLPRIGNIVPKLKALSKQQGCFYLEPY